MKAHQLPSEHLSSLPSLCADQQTWQHISCRYKGKAIAIELSLQ